MGECFNNALVICGREESVDEVFRQVLDDKPYYDESGGGMTLSGGEPVLQTDFCEAMLRLCRENKIHTAIQTAGFYKFSLLERLLPLVDLVMYDIKGISAGVTETIENYIHADSKLAIENLFQLDKKNIPVIVRMPCVAGVNDSKAEIELIAKELSKLKNIICFKLLPCHGLAKIKYDILDMEFKKFETPSRACLSELEGIAAQYINVESKAETDEKLPRMYQGTSRAEADL